MTQDMNMNGIDDELETNVVKAHDGLPNYQPLAVIEEFSRFVSALLAEGVSDIHFYGDDVAWPVHFGRPLKSNVVVTSLQLLLWCDVFGKSHGGAGELINGRTGSVGAMAILGSEGSQLRLRMTFRRQMRGYGLTVRLVPERPPGLSDAIFYANPIPMQLVDLALNTSAGLILFCGPTGSGKTTMGAALLNEINSTQTRHILTIEDPIEFVHRPIMSPITQREIGDHVDTYANGLENAMRSKPDVILVGELLNLATTRSAFEAASKGHLVFSTTHASSAEEAVASLITQFPGNEQNQVATQLAQALKAIVVQRLVPTIDGKLVPARELLLNNLSVSQKIRNLQFNAIPQALKPADSMFSFEDDLAMLWAQDRITEETAMLKSNDKAQMRQKLAYAKDNKADVAEMKNRIVHNPEAR